MSATPSVLVPRVGRRFRLNPARLANLLRGEDRGMTTAEYAVGTVAACGFAGVLYKLLTSDVVVSLLTEILRRAFGLLG
ncbi:MAG TPA: DUF4244 domain-containing protein [Jiangellales bacterium]|jgi:hypothetical protein|nr:DUF4244 domain-containing protein [Jiangellales bacterium]